MHCFENFSLKVLRVNFMPLIFCGVFYFLFIIVEIVKHIVRSTNFVDHEDVLSFGAR
jgi:hypothetical protein